MRSKAMTDRLTRTVIEPVNPKLNVSRNANLPHSPGIRVGEYIFLSGMGPVDPVSGGRNLGPIAEQIRQTLRNMAHMLESAGSGLDRIVKVNVVLADIQDYDEMNRVWRESFRPSRRRVRPAPFNSVTATAWRSSASPSAGGDQRYIRPA